ncbi:hypothetical protein EDI_030540 [Entamoeba dispar SAW760]|uniref:Uncharacterized protein n=1 Tax=Entamoeba dispar (strain ATCC PRA-260 / SAW760) TaxID=370354 RepID=B0EI36_ENTDS|nr:uncharacterized protein EDI_030540 [Entamoeba dispar SAW760]EDR25816.1 hypothetical protein EDI_030540 [Entamoeba dispar SAW760]|eukprot:EDR25816.1 hypothetical protein EDI_030540 [Entamoeba dispar SAW760]
MESKGKIKEEKESVVEEKNKDKAPKGNVSEKKRKSRNGFVLHSNALLYLLLKKGWTIQLTKTKTAKVTLQNYKCIRLYKKGMMIEEYINEENLNELSSLFEDIFKAKECSDDKNIRLEQADLIPHENSSETVSDDKIE